MTHIMKGELLCITMILVISVFSSADEASPCAHFLLVLYFGDITFVKQTIKYKLILIFPKCSLNASVFVLDSSTNTSVE